MFNITPSHDAAARRTKQSDRDFPRRTPPSKHSCQRRQPSAADPVVAVSVCSAAHLPSSSHPSAAKMSDLCPVYAPFFSAMVRGDANAIGRKTDARDRRAARALLSSLVRDGE